MKTAEIRKRWLDFFEKKGHTVVPSASLVNDDPNLLFTVAGMVPFVPYFTNVVPAPFGRATSVQKCIRTNDIEEVGRTPRHGTFFQMCGNFSFGDYFKRGAIEFAWELLTTSEAEGGLGFDPKDLWVTVYKEDDEAHGLWREISGLPEDRIQRLDKDTNYWSTGQPGPAGPCSEIFFDRGREYGQDGGPATDDDRYVEIWNLVFMQYEIDNVKSKIDFNVLGELPKKNIDTGLGLERVAFIKQGVDNMYEIDQVRPVLDRAAELAGVTYGENAENDVRLRVVADHVRSSLMLIGDGVTPSNVGRGYILRRLLRRVIVQMRLLGVEGATFPELFPVSRDAMSPAYPEVADKYDFISKVAYAEEKAFLRTISSGLVILDGAIESAKGESKPVAGDAAFLLHDTHGFPIELTVELAEEAGLQVDHGVFGKLMQEQRDRAKAAAKNKKGQAVDKRVYESLRALGETKFVGYEELEGESRVLGLLVDGQPAQRASAGQTVEVVLAETTLFAESGGQDSDQGQIIGDNFIAEVLDVQRTIPGLIVHTVQLQEGEIAVDDKATTKVDAHYRYGARQAHSGTHIMHAVLRQVLGQQAYQVGSYNKAGYLRLDYAHGEALSAATKTEVEEVCNLAIRESLDVCASYMPMQQAQDIGALSLFGDKYEDIVRVVEIGGPWSRELCGGTHVKNSSQVSLISLMSESSVSSTSRRVEALVGFEAFQNFAAERALVTELSNGLKVPRAELAQRVHDIAAHLKSAEKKIAQLEMEKLTQQLPELLENAQQIGGSSVIAADLGTIGCADDLRAFSLQIRDKWGSAAGVAVLFGVLGEKPFVVAA
ncbi:MAG: alanine--tRNA ligase, partial [Microbacteriaceae bacterium]|nr:alanine--tRNA ligase [Microbacteriaceae bacterium]